MQGPATSETARERDQEREIGANMGCRPFMHVNYNPGLPTG